MPSQSESVAQTNSSTMDMSVWIGQKTSLREPEDVVRLLSEIPHHKPPGIQHGGVVIVIQDCDPLVTLS